ncbi:MAG TPA: dTDP-4-dehydrorhamnose 3,5-epimerase [Bacillota bacterium]|nr:dTDP-4-dehydrorhamnose 3,5-epimerase [Bacillota bacterium]
MGGFIFTRTPMEGLLLIKPRVYTDERGSFMESYHRHDFARAGLDAEFVQANESHSSRGVLRGLHFQPRFSQGKLVRVIAGEVFDVAVDLRRDSTTLGQWYGIRLTGANRWQFYIPPGFAHGFLVLSDEAVFLYQCTDYYHSDDQAGIRWDDPELGIDWPVDGTGAPILSERDRGWPGFSAWRNGG